MTVGELIARLEELAQNDSAMPVEILFRRPDESGAQTWGMSGVDAAVVRGGYMHLIASHDQSLIGHAITVAQRWEAADASGIDL